MCCVPDAVRAASGLQPDTRFTFPVRYRLKKRADFETLYTRGARVAGRHVVLFVAPTVAAQGRYGVTASRRVGGAVVRSRCKRRLRELYRLHRELPGVAELDIVANARRSLATAPWAVVVDDFVRCLDRAAVVTRARAGGTSGASQA